MSPAPSFRRSSVLVSLPVLGLLLLGGVLAAFFRQERLAFVLMFVFLLAGASRAWAALAARKVSVSVSGAARGMLPGEEVRLELTVRNDKFLPLVWLELFFPLSRSLCLTPEESRKPDDWEMLGLEEMGASTQLVGEKRCSFLLWYETARLSIRWRANRRGVYSSAGWRLRTGDGFGLTQIAARRPLDPPPVFVVYPRRVEVDPGPFLRQLWSGQTGDRGYFEDVTVMKSVRPYLPGDSWKRIDWRLAARDQGLQVRQYETIRPRTVHFILDGTSFLGLSPENDELEDALSLLASLLVELDGAGVRCGLSLPQTDLSPNADLSPDDRSLTAADLLFQLAGFDGDTARSAFPGSLLASMQNSVGQMCLITHSRARLSCAPLLGQLDAGRLLALPYDDGLAPGADPLGECTVLPLNRLRGGTRHG